MTEDRLLQSGIPLQVMSVEGFRDWHQAHRGEALHLPLAYAPFAYVIGTGFRWTCPDCAQPFLARVGDEPISGWENPQWTLTGSYETPTVTPSLGCGRMKQGAGHHWWLRDGRMVAA